MFSILRMTEIMSAASIDTLSLNSWKKSLSPDRQSVSPHLGHVEAGLGVRHLHTDHV